MNSVKQLVSMVLVLLVGCTSLFAQQALSNWSNVENLKPGARIVVRTKNGREFIGSKRQSTDDTLFMEANFAVQGARMISLSKNEIAEVDKRKSRWFLPIIGAAVGIGAGLAWGAVADRKNYEDPGLGKALGAVFGGGIGLAAGSAAATMKPRTTAVYVAP
ncbi:MAG: hypothetical protein ABR607_01100 [Pyrinomonadaceae bacterium]